MANEKQNVVIGRRQILRELKCGNVEEIHIASDADRDYIASLIYEAKKYGAPYKIHGTCAEFSEHFGIDVPSGAVGKLK